GGASRGAAPLRRATLPDARQLSEVRSSGAIWDVFRRDASRRRISADECVILTQEAQQRRQRQAQNRRMVAIDPLEQMDATPLQPVGTDRRGDRLTLGSQIRVQ